MIIPSIDLMDGHAVQLVGGKEKVLDAGDPLPLAESFALAGEIAVIDLDAALGRGSNEALIRRLLRVARCRVGGGIRDVETAIRWLDAGAETVLLGTAAVPEVLERLPADRVIAALDSVDGEIVVDGWRRRTGVPVETRLEELRSMVGGFLLTFVEREGRMGGVDEARVERLVAAAGTTRLTIAGGIAEVGEIAAMDRLGADAQVGMALYTGKFELADAITAPLRSDREDGLWPTVVCDERGIALGLAWSDAESVREAVRSRRGVYHSRSRGLWIKGESSGNVQELLEITPDCDRDALRFIVRQRGAGFCHLGTRGCWGDARGLARLEPVLASRARRAPRDSYTRRLLHDAALLRAKLIEEAGELADARDPDHVAGEAADLFYFSLTALARADVSLVRAEQELDRRSRRVTRRPGEAKGDR